MALELINIGAQDNDGTGDSLRVASAKTNRMFQEIYLSLNDPRVAAVGQDLLLGSASKIAIVNANLPALTTIYNNLARLLSAEAFAQRAEAAAAVAQAFVNGKMYATVAAGTAANLDGTPFAVVGDTAATFAIMYQVRSTLYDASGGALPANLTVTRAAGTATRTKPDGTLETITTANTPRFEYDAVKSRTNLLTQSQDFTAFSTTDMTVTGGAADAAGGTTAGRAVPSTNSVLHTLFQAGKTTAPTTTSAYVKPDGYSVVALFNRNTGTYAVFNVSTGAIVSSAGVTATIVAAGNGFYRITAAEAGFGAKAFDLIVPPQNYTSGAPTTAWAANGTSGIIVWRGQIEYGPVATAYILTTTAVGIVIASKGIWVEPASTNWFLQSAVGATGWTKQNATLTADSLTAQTGVPNLSKLEASTTVAAGDAIRVYAQGGDNDPSKTYTRSVYCRTGSSTHKYLWVTRDGAAGQLCFNMETGTVVSAGAGISVVVTALPNGIYRLAITSVGVNAGGNNTFFWLSNGSTVPNVNASTPAGTFCYVGGAQSEVGAVATSYIPTAGATVTRPAETLGIQNVSGTYRFGFDDGSTQDAVLTAPNGVGVTAPALNRPNVLTVTALIASEVSRTAGKAVVDQAILSSSRLGVYPEQFGAVGDGVVDDTAAFDAMAATGLNITFLPGKSYKIDRANGAIQLQTGVMVTGYQAGRFGGVQRTSIVNVAAGGGIFWYTADASTGEVKMPKIANLSLNADYPIRLNDERTAILKDGAGSNCPAGKKPLVLNCDITARVANQGIGISWSKMFDGEITGCDIVGFDINVLLNGCDLNRYHHNRSQIAARYHVLELGAGSFGSQNVIDHNDLLAIGVNGIFIKSTGRHRRIHDNYIEQGSACLGFIDCSNTNVPTYAGNVGSEQFTTIVRDNRIDGKKWATQFIYGYQAEGQTYGEIIDVGTSGAPATVPALALVSSTGTLLNAVPFTFNQTNKAAFVFQGPDFGIWNGYRTVETPSLRITGRNVCQFTAPAIFADKASLYLRGRDDALVLMPRPNGSNDDPVFNFIFDAGTRLFAAGFTCVAEVIARAPGAGETLSIGSKVDGNGGQLTGAALNADFRKILVQFTSGSSNGCYLKRTQNGGEIEIRSLRVYPLYAQEIPFTSAASVTMGLDQIEGLIEVYGEGAGGGAPAAYIYGFANNRLVKLGESVTNPDALAVTTTQSSDLSTLTFTLSGAGGGKQFTVRRKTLA